VAERIEPVLVAADGTGGGQVEGRTFLTCHLRYAGGPKTIVRLYQDDRL